MSQAWLLIKMSEVLLRLIVALADLRLTLGLLCAVYGS